MKIEICDEIKSLVKRFSLLPQVDAVALAGSLATSSSDLLSDYDLYVYLNAPIDIDKRKEITCDLFRYIEINNCFWEMEDDGILLKEDVPVDIVYREISWLQDNLTNRVEKFLADVGYTTCFWANLMSSKVLFERDNCLSNLQKRFDVPYPQQLRENIIKKNYPLLKLQLPAYYFQIEKAIKRKDFISINHRIAALLASYFDIVFAINCVKHVGEKKIMDTIKNVCKKVPQNCEKDVNAILSSAYSIDTLLFSINSLVQNLDDLLKKENFNMLQ